jgi:hypothetical protein
LSIENGTDMEKQIPFVGVAANNCIHMQILMTIPQQNRGLCEPTNHSIDYQVDAIWENLGYISLWKL